MVDVMANGIARYPWFQMDGFTDDFVFGQTVINPWAARSNPTRVSFFIRKIHRSGRMNPGIWYECTDGKGKVWQSGAIVHNEEQAAEFDRQWMLQR